MRAAALDDAIGESAALVGVRSGAVAFLLVTSSGYLPAAVVVTAVAAQGVKLDRHQLQLDEPLKKLGKFDLPVKLHPEVLATVKVWIVEE